MARRWLIPGDGFPALKDEGQDRVAGWIKRDGGGLAVPEFCDFEPGQNGFGPDLSSLFDQFGERCSAQQEFLRPIDADREHRVDGNSLGDHDAHLSAYFLTGSSRTGRIQHAGLFVEFGRRAGGDDECGEVVLSGFVKDAEVGGFRGKLKVVRNGLGLALDLSLDVLVGILRLDAKAVAGSCGLHFVKGSFVAEQIAGGPGREVESEAGASHRFVLHDGFVGIPHERTDYFQKILSAKLYRAAEAVVGIEQMVGGRGIEGKGCGNLCCQLRCLAGRETALRFEARCPGCEPSPGLPRQGFAGYGELCFFAAFLYGDHARVRRARPVTVGEKDCEIAAYDTWIGEIWRDE